MRMELMLKNSFNNIQYNYKNFLAGSPLITITSADFIYDLKVLIYYLLCLFFITILIYIGIYRYRNLTISLSSFIFFFFNFLIGFFFFLSITNIIKGINEPFYIENLSVFSRYHYLIFVILGSVFAISWFYLRYVPNASPKLQNSILFISKPFLFEESLKLFATWEDNFFGPVFEKIINEMSSNPKTRFIFFFFHFFFSYIIPLTISIFLVNFAFFHGDLRYVLYLLPLSLMSWVYTHFFFYFIKFLDQNYFAVKDCLVIQQLKPPVMVENNFVGFDTTDISFKLSDKAFNDFGPEYDYKILLNIFQNDFIRLSKVLRFIHLYYTKVSKLSYIIFFIRYLVWIKISSGFFFSEDNIISLANPGVFKIWPPFSVIIRPYATKAYYVKPGAHKLLETATKGAYRGNHPVTTDTDKVDASGDVPFYHQPTHGAGNSNNPSKILSSVVDLKGDPRPQYGSYSEPALGVVWFPEKFLDKEMTNSEAFYNRQDVLDNDKLNTPFPYKP